MEYSIVGPRLMSAEKILRGTFTNAAQEDKAYTLKKEQQIPSYSLIHITQELLQVLTEANIHSSEMTRQAAARNTYSIALKLRVTTTSWLHYVRTWLNCQADLIGLMLKLDLGAITGIFSVKNQHIPQIRRLCLYLLFLNVFV